MMLIVAGVGVGLWVAMPSLRDGPDLDDQVILWAGAVLGGASMVGVPLLLWGRRKGTIRHFGPGRLLWFAQGTAAWLLWPPIVVGRRSRPPGPPIVDPSVPEICYFYGTPLMAVYVTAALLAGGSLRRRARGARLRRSRSSWQERFGLLLGLGWAVTGLYVLSLIYRSRLT